MTATTLKQQKNHVWAGTGPRHGRDLAAGMPVSLKDAGIQAEAAITTSAESAQFASAREISV